VVDKGPPEEETTTNNKQTDDLTDTINRAAPSKKVYGLNDPEQICEIYNNLLIAGNGQDKKCMEAAEWLLDNYYKRPILKDAWYANKLNIAEDIEKNIHNRNLLRKGGRLVSKKQEIRDRALSCLLVVAKKKDISLDPKVTDADDENWVGIVSGTNDIEEKKREINEVGVKLHTLLLEDILGKTHRSKVTINECALARPEPKKNGKEDEEIPDCENIYEKTVNITGKDTTGKTVHDTIEGYDQWLERQAVAQEQFEGTIDLANIIQDGVITQLESSVIREHRSGEKFADIAKKYNISSGNARLIKFRGVEKLKKFVEDSIKQIFD